MTEDDLFPIEWTEDNGTTVRITADAWKKLLKSFKELDRIEDRENYIEEEVEDDCIIEEMPEEHRIAFRGEMWIEAHSIDEALKEMRDWQEKNQDKDLKIFPSIIQNPEYK